MYATRIIDGGSTHLWNVGRQSFYKAVHPKRQFWTSYSPPWELEISHYYHVHKSLPSVTTLHHSILAHTFTLYFFKFLYVMRFLSYSHQYLGPQTCLFPNVYPVTVHCVTEDTKHVSYICISKKIKLLMMYCMLLISYTRNHKEVLTCKLYKGMITVSLWEISGSHGSEYEDESILGSSTA
jgi:hypothetical protein